MIWPRFDKVHSVIMDLSLSLKHCCNGIFLLTQLFSAYIVGINYKPSNSGHFFDLKKSLLNSFLATHTFESDLFQKHCHKIANDFGIGCGTSDDAAVVFKSLSSMLKSFVQNEYK